MLKSVLNEVSYFLISALQATHLKCTLQEPDRVPNQWAFIGILVLNLNFTSTFYVLAS